MKYHIIFSFFFIFLLMSCEKKPQSEDDTNYNITTNLDEIINTLDSSEFITISPQPEDTIDLNQTFLLQTYTKTVKYIKQHESGKKSTKDIEVGIYIYNIEILDSNNIAYSFTKTETDTGQFSLELSEILNPDSKFKIAIQYTYNHSSTHALEINDFKRQKEYFYNTNEHPELFSYLVYCQYPLDRQYNYLQDEYSYGFIKLYQKPDYILNEHLVAKITNINTGEYSSRTMDYDEELEILKYEMPVLANNSIYKIEFLIDGVEFYPPNYFKTSKYNTFSDKIGTAFEGENKGALSANNAVHYTITYYNREPKDEPMDYYERISSFSGSINTANLLNGVDYIKLVTVEIDTQKTDLNVFGYDYARKLGFKVDRATDYAGFKPVKDFIYISNNIFNMEEENLKLSDSEISNKKPKTSEYYYTIINNWSWIFSEDIREFHAQASNLNNSPLKDSILNLKYTFNRDVKMKYYYKMHYQIPGINKIVFTGEYEVGP